MSSESGPSKNARLAMGIAGFVVLAGSTPCILALIRDGYAGSDDMVGLFGLGGLILLVLYIGILLLYQALKTPKSTSSNTTK